MKNRTQAREAVQSGRIRPLRDQEEGATGAGCALDAQLVRGLRTVLLDSGDFASAASQRFNEN